MLTELWISQRYLRRGAKEKIISITAVISVIGVAVGVMVLIVVIAVMSGFGQYLQEKMIGINSHMFLEFYQGSSRLDGVTNKLENMPQIAAVAPFVAGQAFITYRQQVIGVEMRGIEPQSQSKVTRIKEYIKQGSLSLKDNEIILGEELAFRLGLKIGDDIKLVSPVNFLASDFKIKGIFNTGMYLYDSGLVMTNIKTAQDFFKMGNNVTGLGIRAGDVYDIESVRKEIYKNLGESGSFEVRTWFDANRNFLNALKLEKIVMFIVVTMTTVVAAFGIVSTLMMSVMSKTRDIGILRSIGAKAKSILQIFVFQGLSIGIMGIILGLISGLSLALSLNKIIDFISRMIGRSLIPKDIYYFDRIPTSFNFSDISVIVMSALLISLLASIYPALYALRINPTEAIRHE